MLCIEISGNKPPTGFNKETSWVIKNPGKGTYHTLFPSRFWVDNELAVDKQKHVSISLWNAPDKATVKDIVELRKKNGLKPVTNRPIKTSNLNEYLKVKRHIYKNLEKQK